MQLRINLIFRWSTWKNTKEKSPKDIVNHRQVFFFS
jgi:hypothetical protein